MKIPIRREEGYHTNVLGTYTDGQCMGFAFFLEPYQKHLISALHLFDSAGNQADASFKWNGVVAREFVVSRRDGDKTSSTLETLRTPYQRTASTD